MDEDEYPHEMRVHELVHKLMHLHPKATVIIDGYGPIKDVTFTINDVSEPGNVVIKAEQKNPTRQTTITLSPFTTVKRKRTTHE